MFGNIFKGITSSLRIKIVFSLIGMSIFSIALGSFVSRTLLVDRFEDVVIMRSSDGFVRDVLGYYRQHGSFEQAASVESFDNYRTRIGRPQGQQYGASPPADAARFIGTDLSGKVWAPAGSLSVGDVVSEQELRDAIPIMDGDVPIGYTVTEGQLLLSRIEEEYLIVLRNAWWLSLLLVALVAIPLEIFLGKRLTDPINTLSGALRAMRPTAMHQTVPITSNDEIGLLSKSFNQMSEELASYVKVIESQKEKIANTEAMRREGMSNISHELRTPLNTSVAQVHAMLDGIRPIDREQTRKLADSLHHLTELVGDLFQLSLSDIHALKRVQELVNFPSLVREAIEAHKEQFSAKNFSLSTSLPDELAVEGDSTRLRQIVENLLANCVRYSNQGGKVEIDLSVVDRFAQLTVSDDGPGVPSDSLDLLFDRFYRVESSRSRATGGTGLGLSLVKTYAEIQGGSAEAFLSNHGGLGIRVRIPLGTAIA